MFTKRTDLALEAGELWRETAKEKDQIPGVRVSERRRDGYPVTHVQVLDKEGEKALGKPKGSYATVDLTDYWQRRAEFFPRAVQAVGRELKPLLPEKGAVLVVGLGNREMTPDAVGPLAADHVLATRHLVESMPKHFGSFRPVAVFRTGVLGTTGVETAETVRGLTEELHPQCIIAVDALASRRCGRVCSTVQISDVGIVPGSGVGNHRSALNRESLGIPVIVIGVPTVVDAATLAADVLSDSGYRDFSPEKLQGGDGMMVTPRDIDAQVRELARVVGYGINWALQELDVEEISDLLG